MTPFSEKTQVTNYEVKVTESLMGDSDTVSPIHLYIKKKPQLKTDKQMKPSQHVNSESLAKLPLISK